MYPSIRERFFKKVTIGNPNECWEWEGVKYLTGYGHLRDGAKQKYAHRLSYEIYHGSIPAGFHICHKCDNPGCVNPNHLFAGTAKDNMHDMAIKNRSAFGERRPQSKLKENQVREIIEKHSMGVLQKHLAKEYGVIPQCISLIITGKRWCRVTHCSNEAIIKIESPLARVIHRAV